MRNSNTNRSAPSLCAMLSVIIAALALAQCGSPAPKTNAVEGASAKTGSGNAAAVAAWNVIYGVLQHPRCLNCHPAGDVPLQGEDSEPHPQNVQRGPAGHGRFAMRCDACHQTQNLAGLHQPPGAPNWHLPRADLPLVFEGKSSGDLCRQLRDPAQNGGRTPDLLLRHLTDDPLVLWGWDPGEGRAPVATPQAEFTRAVATWVENGCGCPPQ